jgi:predicted Zn finger-like uncharacterized protein
MKFSCPSCQAKYFVRDEDVLGRTLKLRCHRCSGEIPIQGRRRSDPAGPLSSDRLRLSLPLEISGARAAAGVLDAAPLSSSAPPVSSSAPPVSSAPASRPSLPPPLPAELAVGEYFVGIAGKAVGPLDAAELEQRALRGEIGPRTYVWHAGLLSWQRLARVPELGHLALRLAVGSASGTSGSARGGDAHTLEERLGFGYLGEASPSTAAGDRVSERHVRLAAPAKKATPPSEGMSLFVGLVISLALGVALGALL